MSIVIGGPQRGEVYWVDFDPRRGSEQGGVRPAVVISSDLFNRHWPVCTVAAITSQVKKSSLVVDLPAGQPTPVDSQILPWQLHTIAHERLGDYIGDLSPEQLEELCDKLRMIWELG